MCGRPPCLAGQPLQGRPKKQGHSVLQWQQKFADFDGIPISSLSAVGGRGGGWLYGREDRGGVAGGEDCDKVTVEVVGDVVGEVIGECDEDGSEVGVFGGGSPSPSNWEKVGWKPAFLSTFTMRRRFSSFGEG